MDGSLSVEVLAVGTHKGIPFTREDLDAIAANHAALADYVKPPVRLGHSKAQLLAGQSDGDPALGWISALKRKGDKLVATLTGVPSRLMDMIRKGRYRRVSSELALDFARTPWEQNLRTGITGKVLTGLALLGADLPAVANLEDLGTLLASEDGEALLIAVDGPSPFPRTMSPVATSPDEETRMSEHENQPTAEDRIAELEAQLAKRDEQGSRLEEQIAELTAKLGTRESKQRIETAPAVKELLAELKQRDDRITRQDGEIAKLTAKMHRMESEAEAERKRRAESEARQRETEADRFVESYSQAGCLKLTSPLSKAGVRALYLHLAAVEAPIVSEDASVELKLSEKPRALSGVDVLKGVLDALPDEKVRLTQVSRPGAGLNTDGDPDADEYDRLMAEAAEKYDLDLSTAAGVAEAAQKIQPQLRGRPELMYGQAK